MGRGAPGHVGPGTQATTRDGRGGSKEGGKGVKGAMGRRAVGVGPGWAAGAGGQVATPLAQTFNTAQRHQFAIQLDSSSPISISSTPGSTPRTPTPNRYPNLRARQLWPTEAEAQRPRPHGSGGPIASVALG